MKVVTAETMQRLDRRTIEEAGIPGMVLMENAGRGAAGEILRSYPRIRGGRVAVVAGRGNNGGDGFVIARYLLNHGVGVKVFVLTSPGALQGDARANFAILLQMKAAVSEITDRDVWKANLPHLAGCVLIVDALLGTGLKSEVTGLMGEVINDLNGSGVPIVSVDLPSGLHADTGAVLGTCAKADLTITLALPKRGLFIYPGADYAGRVKIVDISIPPFLIEEEGIRDQLLTFDGLCLALRPRSPVAHKGDCGHVLVVAGSRGKTGAAALACRGAARVGAGLVTLAVPESLHSIMEMKLTEVMTEPLCEEEAGFLGIGSLDRILELMAGKQVLALGPGLSTHDGTVRLIRALVEQSTVPLVIDADGINALCGNLAVLRGVKVPVVLTPHPGEMARLVGSDAREVQRNRLTIARDCARQYGCYVVLKGARSLIADPGGGIAINLTGNAGMASGGMGDVLTGMIAGFMAQGYECAASAQLGVFCHGLAGDLVSCEKGSLGISAGDVLRVVPRVLNALLERRLPPALDSADAYRMPVML